MGRAELLRLGPANASVVPTRGTVVCSGGTRAPPRDTRCRLPRRARAGSRGSDRHGGRVAFAGFERDAPGSFGDVTTTTDTSVLSALNVGDAAWASRDVVALVADDGSGRANLCSFRVPPESEDPTASDPTSPIEVTLVKHTARRDFCVRHVALDAATVARGDATVTAVYASGGRLFASELGTELDVADGAAKGSAKNIKTRSRARGARDRTRVARRESAVRAFPSGEP